MLWAQPFDRRDVEVEVVNDRGRSFPQYPLRQDRKPAVYKAHLEAMHGSRYSIQIRNRSNQRVGVVIAVDGRNIITGKRSHLRSSERMYILEPHQQETYEGWRTDKNRVNRFYFTDAGDSYAGAWGDYSALGVIAVAAFQEATSYRPPQSQPWSEGRQEDRRGDEPRQQSAPAAAGAPRSLRAAPGTGYGESEWSPSRQVEFEPQRQPMAQFFLKYAWRDTLCRQQIIDCDGGDRRRSPHNRFWDEKDDYAPPPPRHDRQFD